MLSEFQLAIKTELKSTFKMGSGKRHWTIPLMASLSVGMPILIALLLGDFKSGLTVGLGGLVILYLPANENIVGRISKLLLCSFGFIISYLVGIAFSFNSYVSCVTFGIYAGIVYFVTKMIKLNPPGNFFFIMIAAMASGLPFSVDKIPHNVGLLTLGTLFSCFVAFVFSVLLFKPNINKDMKETLSKLYISNDVDYLEAFIVGVFMTLSFLLAHFLGVKNPYWVPISCLAVMQGVNTTHIWRRGFYRILGTLLGMLLCWVILSLVKMPVEMILAIMLLQYIIEILIVKNYFFAVLFITPMTVLLSEAGSSMVVNPDVLIVARLKDVLMGSVLGAIGGWVIYNEQLRYQVVKHIRVTRRNLK